MRSGKKEAPSLKRMMFNLPLLSQVTIGQRVRLSYLDTFQMNKLYSCGEIATMYLISSNYFATEFRTFLK